MPQPPFDLTHSGAAELLPQAKAIRCSRSGQQDWADVSASWRAEISLVPGFKR